MRLLAFRIKNFRSIVDSGLNNLSSDNITVLIGQNESGKTTVLEALRSFYNGALTDDMLRSDLSLPEVACLFEMDDDELRNLVSLRGVPPEMSDALRQDKKILVIRSWNEDKSSVVRVGGEKIEEIYSNRIHQSQEEEKELFQLAKKLIDQEEELGKKLLSAHKEQEQIKKRLSQLSQQITDLKKGISKAKKAEQKERMNLELDRLTLEATHLDPVLSEVTKQLDEMTVQSKQVGEKSFYARNVIQAAEKLSIAQGDLDQAKALLMNLEKKEPAISLRVFKQRKQLADEAREECQVARLAMQSARREAVYSKKLLSNIIKGMPHEQARSEASRETGLFMELLMPEELGAESMKFIPAFELFEDFGSLLPNRIDLDDLIEKNANAEGYKAARNLLIIAGVDAQFFTQQNNRILKQKIETLNGELTVDFQDYWHQNVGKKSKIRIQFDLEHYDTSNPEKKGKPYLEFWIKDEHERLYPKQRSRGVRWFLSFYLELKATAIYGSTKRILLIDEPGLSLHARAQEDVLRVFEDIRDRLMVIYTTHSPHLVDISRMHRILAVQRAIETDEDSETKIFDVHSLSRASADTLSPVYSLMGAHISDQQILQKKSNVIVEDTSAYYFMTAFFSLLEVAKQVSFIPASGPAGITALANILTGWKLDFVVLTSDTEIGEIVRNELKINLFGNDDNIAAKHLLSVDDNRTVVDLLSTIDFKNHVLHKRVGITESNAEYIVLNNLSLAYLAYNFYQQVREGNVKWNDLDDESRANITEMAERILDIL